jgi:hypothetical protein
MQTARYNIHHLVSYNMMAIVTHSLTSIILKITFMTLLLPEPDRPTKQVKQLLVVGEEEEEEEEDDDDEEYLLPSQYTSRVLRMRYHAE